MFGKIRLIACLRWAVSVREPVPVSHYYCGSLAAQIEGHLIGISIFINVVERLRVSDGRSPNRAISGTRFVESYLSLVSSCFD